MLFSFGLRHPIRFSVPNFLGLARTTPRRGGNYLKQERQKLQPDADIVRTIKSVARKWSYPAFDRLFPFEERLQIGFEAVWINAGKVFAARNPEAMARVVADRKLANLYRNEFHHGAPRFQQFGEFDDAKLNQQVTEKSLIRAEGFSDAGSKYAAELRTEDWNERFQKGLRELPAAMAKVEPVKQYALKLHFGFVDGRYLSIRAITDVLDLKKWKVEQLIENSVQKLRQYLGVVLSAN